MVNTASFSHFFVVAVVKMVIEARYIYSIMYCVDCTVIVNEMIVALLCLLQYDWTGW